MIKMHLGNTIGEDSPGLLAGFKIFKFIPGEFPTGRRWEAVIYSPFALLCAPEQNGTHESRCRGCQGRVVLAQV